MQFPLRIVWSRSRLLLVAILALHGAAVLAVATSEQPAGGRMIAAVLLVASAMHALLACWRSTGQLILHRDGRCQFRARSDGEFLEARLRWYSLWPTLGAIAIDVPEQRVVLVISPAALAAADQRRLRIWLRTCAPGCAAAPDPAPE
jgi:hypothetical protein